MRFWCNFVFRTCTVTFAGSRDANSSVVLGTGADGETHGECHQTQQASLEQLNFSHYLIRQNLTDTDSLSPLKPLMLWPYVSLISNFTRRIL